MVRRLLLLVMIPPCRFIDFMDYGVDTTMDRYFSSGIWAEKTKALKAVNKPKVNVWISACSITVSGPVVICSSFELHKRLSINYSSNLLEKINSIKHIYAIQ